MNILVAEDSRQYGRYLASQLGKFGKVTLADDLDKAKEYYHSNEYDSIFIDLDLKGKSGLELLKAINAKNALNRHKKEIETFILTSNDSEDAINNALELGANHYFTKEALRNDIDKEIGHILKRVEIEKFLENDLEKIFCTKDEGLIREIANALKLGTNRNICINFRGPSGTGKTYTAKLFAEILDGKNSPFESINIQEISNDIKESELFGHEKSSFTGADSKKNGIFERANNGSLFLDEIQDLSYHDQGRLRKPLDEKVIRPLGSSPIDLDIRIMTGSNTSLWQRVEEKRFREDLYNRIKGANVHFPSLKNRREDIPLYLDRFKSQYKKVIRLSSSALEVFCEFDWPGNVRDLHKAFDLVVSRAKGKIEGDVVRQVINESFKQVERNRGFWGPDLEKILKNHGYDFLDREIDIHIFEYIKRKFWNERLGKIEQRETCRELNISQSVFRRLRALWEERQSICGGSDG